MSLEENKKIALRMLEDLSNRKIDACLASMADTATWWIGGSFPLSGTKTKKEFADILASIGPRMAQWLKITPKTLTAEGDRVAVEAESYAKLTNGRVYSNQYHFLIEVRDGKIQSVREYLDTMHANDVLCS